MNLFLIIIAIIIISSVVGAVSKLFNNLNEMNNAARARPQVPPPRPGGGGGGMRQPSSDMDRFLAEIDRLRKKTTEAPPPQQSQAPVVPVVQPTKQPDRPRPRVVAELAEAPPQRTDGGFTQSFPSAPPATAAMPPRAELPVPVATVVVPPSGTGAPATRVTKLASRPRPVAKTPFAKNLTGLLNSGQGLAMAIVLQEVLGPPKMKKKR
jgi:hypothetical protein